MAPRKRRGSRLRFPPKRRKLTIEDAKAELLKISAAVIDHIHNEKRILQNKARNYLEVINKLKENEECMGDLEISQVANKLSRQMRVIIEGNDDDPCMYCASEDEEVRFTPIITDLNEFDDINNELRSSQTTPDLGINVHKLSTSFSFIDINNVGTSHNNDVNNSKNLENTVTKGDAENVNPIVDICNTPPTNKIKKCLRQYVKNNKELETAQSLHNGNNGIDSLYDLDKESVTNLPQNKNMQVKTHFNTTEYNHLVNSDHTYAQINTFSENANSQLLGSQSILADYKSSGNSSGLNTMCIHAIKDIQPSKTADNNKKTEGCGQNSGPIEVIVNENVILEALKSPILFSEDLLSEGEKLNSNIITEPMKSIQLHDEPKMLFKPNIIKSPTFNKVSKVAKKNLCYEELIATESLLRLRNSDNECAENPVMNETILTNFENDIPINSIFNLSSNNLPSQNTETLYIDNMVSINKRKNTKNKQIDLRPLNSIISNINLTNTIPNSENTIDLKRDKINIKGATKKRIRNKKKKTSKNIKIKNNTPKTILYEGQSTKYTSNEVTTNTQHCESSLPHVANTLNEIRKSDCSWIREIKFVRYVEPDEYTDTDLGIAFWYDNSKA